MTDYKNTHVCIAYPSGDLVNVRFMGAFINLLAYSKDIPTGWANFISSRIADNRNYLVQNAKDMKATHILFIDSDMTFPPDGLRVLLDHDKDIIGATASRRQEGDRNPIGIPANPNDAITNKHLVEMQSMGLPFMLIKMEVFEKLHKPYFAEPILGEDLIPEDAYFCHKAQEAGYQVWCDMVLSTHMGHLGVKEYKIEEAKEQTDFSTTVDLSNLTSKEVPVPIQVMRAA